MKNLKLLNNKVLAVAIGGFLSIASVPSATTVATATFTTTATIASLVLTTDAHAGKKERLERQAERLRQRVENRDARGKDNGAGSKTDRLGDKGLDKQGQADGMGFKPLPDGSGDGSPGRG